MTDVVARLVDALPPDEVVQDPDVIAAYARDAADLCPVGEARALVRARSVASVATTLRLAHEARCPVVTRGAGTGLSGGANAIDGCLLLSVAKLDRILHIDRAARLAKVQAGVLNGDLDRAAAEHGLMYAPDPASRDISSIGGNVATNAGGACCLKYGVTGDHVAEITAVLADGSIIHTGATSGKNVAGLDLNRLLVGSEGTLAVIVEVTVRLLPRRAARGTLVAFFSTLADAGRAIVELGSSASLSRLEVMDQTTVRAVDDLLHLELDRDAAAMVLAQADTADAQAIIAAAETTCERHASSTVFTTLDESEGKVFMQARSAALPALEKRGPWLLDDVAVAPTRIPELLELCARAANDHEVVVGTFGHAGDGNLHPTLIYDGEDGRRRALAAFDAILMGTLELGGTVTGEHGVGLLKRPHLERMLGSRELQLMRGIKTVFDPRGILNPGKGY
ncbi:MAG: FAD-linked oxidase C-terminal domain-containing protein [Polyangiaceae bacterium]